MDMSEVAIWLPTERFLLDGKRLEWGAEGLGCHIRLVMAAWQSTDCRLPDNDEELARIIGAPLASWLKIKPRIMPVWQLHEGFWSMDWLRDQHAAAQRGEEWQSDKFDQWARPV